MSGDRTTKAGTAIPSTRQGTSPYDQPPPQTAASMVMYKSMVKSSNFGSVVPSSTGSPLRHGTAGPYHIRKGSMALSNFPNPPGVTNSQHFPNVNGSNRFSQSDLVVGED